MYRIKILIVIVFLFCILNELSFAQRPQDIDGWNKVKWGMTEEEIMNVYGVQVRKSNTQPGETFYSNLELDNLSITNNPFRVTFFMDNKTKKLVFVRLTPNRDKYSYGDLQEKLPNINPLLLELAKTRAIFDDLEKELIGKYGKPDYISDKPSKFMNTQERTWYFPSTTIKLEYFWVDQTDMLFLDYIQKSVDDDNDLL